MEKIVNKISKIKEHIIGIVISKLPSKKIYLQEKVGKKPAGKLFIVFIPVLLVILSIAAVSFVIRGVANFDYFSKVYDTQIGGPFEASNSTARYALVKSLAESRSFTLSLELAKFASPDIVYHEGKFISIFAPGISFLSLPLYFLGKPYGIEQLTTFSFNSIFAVVNVLLIFIYCKKLTGNSASSAIAALIYLLATNVLAFSGTLTQHVFTTTLLLLSLTTKSYILLGVVYGIAALVDVPNVLIFAPVIIYRAFNSLKIKHKNKKASLKINLKVLGFLIGFVPLIGVFAYYNFATAGSPATLAQFLGRAEGIEKVVQTYVPPVKEEDPFEKNTTSLPFDSRDLTTGLYILLISDERGILYYYPVLLFAILGFAAALRNEKVKDEAILGIAVIGTLVLTYGMFGDPWGGWSFGARYMIPANAILAIFTGYAVFRYGKSPFFVIIFIILASYSLYVNALGAFTTASVPPKGEAIRLLNPVPYTYEYNKDLIDKDKSSSLVFNSLFQNKISLWNFINYFVLTEILIIIFFYIVYFYEKQKYET
jgi:hypothetical protein